ncbi:MAG: translation initiation factor IF-3 [Syntrophorhabdales bacterium]
MTSILPTREVKDQTNINEKIRAREVRLIDEDGKQLGIVPASEALRLAREKELDLVEISPKATPPVCKIMDYGKFKYQLAKKAAEARKKQTVIQVKEMKLGLKIEEHDLQVKLRHMKEFLADGDKVKITVMFRGREILHKDKGETLAFKIIEQLKGTGDLEQKPRFDGRNIIMIFAPV